MHPEVVSSGPSSFRLPRPVSRVLSYIVERNPIYLVSALVMFAGIYTAIQPADQHSGNLVAILSTFAAMEFYEFLLLAIIAFLIRFRLILDDAAKVLFVEAICVIACFIVLDELAFHPSVPNLGTLWGMLALALAALRFTGAGRLVPCRFTWPVLLWMNLLFAWNALAPALMGNYFREINEHREPAWLMGWLGLNALTALLIPLALIERRELILKGRLLKSPLSQWLILGTVLLTTLIHQIAISWTLDIDFYLCDLIPFTLVTTAAIVCIIPPGKNPVLKMHLLVAPAALCTLATLVGEYSPIEAGYGEASSLSEQVGKNLRILNWPVLWLGISAVTTWIFARREKEPALFHLSISLAVLAGLLASNTNPHELVLSLKLGGAVVLAYLHWMTLTRKDVRVFYITHAYTFLYPIMHIPAHQDLAFWSHMQIVFAGLTGCCMIIHWIRKRPWLTAVHLHMGVGITALSLTLQNLLPFSHTSTGMLLVTTLLTAAIFATMAWEYRCHGYYVLSFILVVLYPGKQLGVRTGEVASSGSEFSTDPSIGSSSGWTLIMLAFVLLGIGVFVSMMKPDEEGATA